MTFFCLFNVVSRTKGSSSAFLSALKGGRGGGDATVATVEEEDAPALSPLHLTSLQMAA